MIGNQKRAVLFETRRRLDTATIELINAITAAGGSLTPTEINAANRFFLNVKGRGNLNTSFDFWSITFAYYLMIGGTATTNMFNAKDPRNLDAAFRLSFSGGWVHSSNGITANGTNTFANTFFNPNTLFSSGNGSIGVYIRNNVDEIRYDMGCTQTTNELLIIARGSNLQYANYGPNNAYGTISNTDSRGWFETTRIGGTNTFGRKNGVTVITHAETEGRPNFNIYIGANNNNGTALNFASKQYAFAKIGQSLSDANALLEYQIIQQFQQDLNRQV